MTTAHTILIIEDEALEARFFREALKRAGYDVLGVAPSGEEAMRLTENRSPDLILADIAIEGPMDGIEVSQVLAARTGAGIVYLSGHSDVDLLERAKLTEPPPAATIRSQPQISQIDADFAVSDTQDSPLPQDPEWRTL